PRSRGAQPAGERRVAVHVHFAAEGEGAYEVGAAREPHHEHFVECAALTGLELTLCRVPLCDEARLGRLAVLGRQLPNVPAGSERRARKECRELSGASLPGKCALLSKLPIDVLRDGAMEKDDECAAAALWQTAVDMADVLG